MDDPDSQDYWHEPPHSYAGLNETRGRWFLLPLLVLLTLRGLKDWLKARGK